MTFHKPQSFKRLTPTVSAGSMADIAFLLLIFFLVTTTIVQDKGLLVRLPPWVNEPVTADVNERNVYSILINANNEILAENELIPRDQLEESIISFITNPQNISNAPVSPDKAIISIMNDRNTSYHLYLEVYDLVMAAYHTIWNEEALRSYGIQYDRCDKSQRKEIKKTYPQVISEAEPKEYAI